MKIFREIVKKNDKINKIHMLKLFLKCNWYMYG